MGGLKSLVIAPQWIGDAVMTEPLMRRLAARGEQLTVGALPWVAPVYRAMPQVSAVIELPFAHGGLQLSARRRIASAIRGEFEIAYVCPNSLKSALLPLLAKIPRRVGYMGEARIGLLTHRLKNPPKDKRPPMVAFYSALSGAATTELDNDIPQLHLDLTELEHALGAMGLVRGRYYVFSPGAEFGPAKRWPAAHFTELARQLDLPVVLLGSGKELALCDEISVPVNQEYAGKCINLAGKTSLAYAFAAIAAAKAVISNDSGLMHVAAAFGVPQVAIFGSSSPLHTPPLSVHAQILWLKNDPAYHPALDCAPCFKRVCPLIHTRCLNDITPDKVLLNL